MKKQDFVEKLKDVLRKMENYVHSSEEDLEKDAKALAQVSDDVGMSPPEYLVPAKYVRNWEDA